MKIRRSWDYGDLYRDDGRWRDPSRPPRSRILPAYPRIGHSTWRGTLLVIGGATWLATLAATVLVARYGGGTSPGPVIVAVIGVGLGVGVGERLFRAWVRFLRRRRALSGGEGAANALLLLDHGWDTRGDSVSALRRAVRQTKQLVSLFFMASYAAPQLLVLGRWPIRIVCVIGIAAIVSWWLHRVHETLWFGRTRVRYARFPFRPGEPVELTFGVDEGGGTFHELAFRLLRVHQFPGQSAFTEERFLTYEDRYELREDQAPPTAGTDVEVRFDLPSDAKGTSLDDKQPACWHLEVTGKTDAGDYRERFLIPVYERVTEDSTALEPAP